MGGNIEAKRDIQDFDRDIQDGAFTYAWLEILVKGDGVRRACLFQQMRVNGRKVEDSDTKEVSDAPHP